MSIKRMNFTCWNCKAEFELTRDSDELRGLIYCPYCKSHSVYDLQPYQSNTTEVYRGVADNIPDELSENKTMIVLDLPDAIPTVEPNTEEDE